MANATVSAAATTAATPAATQQPEAQKAYAVFKDFNTSTFVARIQHVEVKAGPKGEFAAVTAITNLKDGESGVAVRFASAGPILTLAKGGHLMAGRQVHLTGTIAGFENAYANADGVIVPLQRPRLQLQGVSLTLGAKPKSARKAAA